MIKDCAGVLAEVLLSEMSSIALILMSQQRGYECHTTIVAGYTRRLLLSRATMNQMRYSFVCKALSGDECQLQLDQE